jgi:hypothetical protein
MSQILHCRPNMRWKFSSATKSYLSSRRQSKT